MGFAWDLTEGVSRSIFSALAQIFSVFMSLAAKISAKLFGEKEPKDTDFSDHSARNPNAHQKITSDEIKGRFYAEPPRKRTA
ncbi:MAG: hypothetical protein FWF66_01520 [Candidatus Bathyarchaeota archaeon]|nr:hypothetical protein [Candidatus Termiticorpusculum sp.]